MRFDTKIVVAVRSDLPFWQKLNVTAFLASGVAAGVGEALAAARERAIARGMPTALYTDDLFATGDDDSNRAAVQAVPAESLALAGVAVYGPRNAVDKVCKGLVLHP